MTKERIAEQNKRKTKTREVALWESRINFAGGRASPYLETFQRNMDFYVGKQFDPDDVNDSLILRDKTVVVNRMLATLAAQNSQIMWRLPWFRLVPRQPLGQAGDQNLLSAEMALNYIMSHPANNTLLMARLFVLAAHMAYGVLKVSFDPDMGIEPEEDDEEETGTPELLTRADGTQVLELTEGRPKVRDGRMVTNDEGIVLESFNFVRQFRLDWVDWRDLRHDPEGQNDLRDHTWMAQRFEMRLDHFMKNKMFSNKQGIKEAAVRITHASGNQEKARRLDSMMGTLPTHIRTSGSAGGYEGDIDEDMLRLAIWQIWDWEEQRVKYMVEGHDKLVANEKIPRWIDHSPYVIGKIHEVPGEFFPYTEAEAARPLLRSYNISRSQRLTHARRSNRKYQALEGAVDDDEMEKLKNPEDGTVLLVKQLDAIRAIEDAPLDSQIFADMELDIRDMSEIFGTTPEARGTAQGETATQAAILERRGSSREQDKRALLGAALSEAADKMLDCLQQNLSEPLAVRIAGPLGQPFEASLSRVDILGDFESRVEIVDMEPHDLNTERAQLIQLVQILGPIAMRVPMFVERVLRAFRFNDPTLVQEMSKAYQEAQLLELMMAQQQQAQQNQTQRQGMSRPGGAKPQQQGPQGGNTQEGRREGRNMRGAA